MRSIANTQSASTKPSQSTPSILLFPLCSGVLAVQVEEVQHQTEPDRVWLLSEYPAAQLYQLKRKCNGCQEQDLSLLEGELVALLEDRDPHGSSTRWLVHTGGPCLCMCVCVYLHMCVTAILYANYFLEQNKQMSLLTQKC